MADAPKGKGFFGRGGAWVLAQFVLLAFVFVTAAMFHEQAMWPGGRILGIVLMLLSGVFGIPGVWILGRNTTPFPHPLDGSHLVRNGIYGRVRHPLYTSVMLGSLGWALVWNSWFALLPALILIPFFQAKVRHEEGWLREKFPEYADYARRIPRFIPRFCRPANPARK